MVSRFQKRGAPPEVTFFVFQDILTSMIGILIIITLTLALRLDGPMGTGKEGTGTGSGLDTKTQLENMLAEIARLRAQLDAAHWGANGSQLSAAALDSELSSLRKQIGVYSDANHDRENKTRSLSYDPNADLWDGEIAGMKLLVKKAQQESAELQAKIDQQKNQAQAIQDHVQAVENEVESERKRLNILRLIPEQSDTSKTPVLVMLDRNGYTILGSMAKDPHGNNPSAFREALRQFDTRTQYMVFFIKPSGANDFQTYKNTASNAAFEVGYDVVGEDNSLELATP